MHVGAGVENGQGEVFGGDGCDKLRANGSAVVDGLADSCPAGVLDRASQPGYFILSDDERFAGAAAPSSIFKSPYVTLCNSAL